MATCKHCGKEFDEPFERDTFSIEFPRLSYESFTVELCADCAREVIEDEIDGIYIETCERCGKRFDYILETSSCLDRCGGSLSSFWDNDILCLDCVEETIG